MNKDHRNKILSKQILLTIGHLAREAEVIIETVRYYQRGGLIQ